eukprot:Plantae.Rhodophyta-Purpureofilum_apyrenoidigerum.ctg8059.p1 GENE.Plantae.Rhodophyta-Purpureofilum_apyrenoidigerum.ctg8059~~Plantae.Rhodophyta-Purpureofilum_apyrenoidigerum.ctg8059.p1  ORF type:complete len:461 (+),score=76.01 Plantae.Rhodophyta-Purpureofilum_apyrenoidigerum.ctg8059:441-1823(+)
MGESTLLFTRHATAFDDFVSKHRTNEDLDSVQKEDHKAQPCVDVRLGRRVILDLLRKRNVECTELGPISATGQEDAALQFIRGRCVNQSFFLINLARLYDQYLTWVRELPRVVPFYAVKCNPDGHILHILDKLGCNFDCASMAEMKSVIKIGVDPSRIIFANPCKKIQHLRWARDHGVRKMTFDNEPELDKIKSIFPSAELVLRIATDDSSSVCRFSMKFGLVPERAEEVLRYAQNLRLNVIGVSFHVGSGCTDPQLYEMAIADARAVFAAADKIGMPKLQLLDIGGGYSGEIGDPLFSAVAEQIRSSLEKHFHVDGYGSDIDIIAEPGRFFAASTHCLMTCVYAKRDERVDPKHRQTLYVDDGVYGSFNSILYDHAHPKAKPLHLSDKDREGYQSQYATTIFGPTCDGLDNLTPDEEVLLPKLDIGDFLIWDSMGAYTCAASGYNFNGMEGPLKFYVFQ